jgi:hypothetical protein
MNAIYYNLAWGRRVVFLHDYFPAPIYKQLLALTSTSTWIDSEQPNRQICTVDNDSIIRFLNNQTLADIASWSSERHQLLSCSLWKDSAGLEYKQHTDKGRFKPWETHLQIYINSGESLAGLGTRFHHTVFHRRPTIELNYTGNAGYFIKRSQSVYHSVAPVPEGQLRYSLYAKFGRIK